MSYLLARNSNMLKGYEVTRQRVIKPLVSDADKKFVRKSIDDGLSLFLPVSYVVPSIKLAHQEVLMGLEAEILLPLLKDTVAGLYGKAKGVGAKELLGAVLKIIDPLKEVTAAAEARAKRVQADKLSKPVGHYEDSEELKTYFQAMTLMMKATFNVDLHPQYSQSLNAYKFDFDVTGELVSLLRQNRELYENWKDIYYFYYVFTGEPDLPTLVDLVDSSESVSKESVRRIAKDMGLPKINQEMGLGVQGMGERFTVIGKTMDDLKRTLTEAEGMDIDEVYNRVKMHTTIHGHSKRLTGREVVVNGLLDRISDSKNRKTYADRMLYGVMQILKDRPRALWGMRGLNHVAVSVTHLREFTVLGSKVPEFMPLFMSETQGLPSIYIESAPVDLFQGLIDTEKMISDLYTTFTDKYRQKYGISDYCLSYQDRREEMATVFNVAVSEDNHFKNGTKEFHACLSLFERLKRDPNVTVNVFTYHSSLGDTSYLQWGTVMAETKVVLHRKFGSEIKVLAPEILFAENWGDKFIPETRAPLANSEWRRFFWRDDRLLEIKNSLLLGDSDGRGFIKFNGER
ncbi:hypothetical protein A2526_04865 [candidate division WOR-1 bacterium RIFOXYD2_FULL_36_8]|uniref:Uncharacterized protein n=1 Tax=candidate division WOR-1 bacterium RIFOXYB2_FULL_36_35 TaxID=1802578 RepID=A0A1F4S3Z0_UNCSA|nr:MAG: hypothetical protein A2230_09485 [candidate division WOR-1 bacterium RIFOXYA2_FULL_36_21]OGC15087.1 MAG: hypothetical protein A2290_09305 [candidate division WOR-1 bacterium RIFOXYB2_FULL_36_35]OGC16468.1 MAG: hypothetical protein A2282_03410 [candidate division WOR-1 bacterium RIFOXYA12_FULL_36_13]OGC41406.1 MAG: hypothetical protein A2526_04865 [candidate division WOR-1 bacterium RIFOXYD2_FULL_36_8]